MAIPHSTNNPFELFLRIFLRYLYVVWSKTLSFHLTVGLFVKGFAVSSTPLACLDKLTCACLVDEIIVE